MPKKKPPKNAFSFFLDDELVKLRNQGKNIKSKQEAVPLVHHKWKDMTAAEKAPYEELAKQAKMNKGKMRPGRLDCTGNRIDDRIDMDKIMLDERKKQKKFLLDRWQQLRTSQVLEEKFYIISFQSYFEFPEEEGYQPCELAVVEYSMLHGIAREFHAMINPGSVKLGLGAEAKIFSEKTHQIPTCGFELGRRDHVALWNELLDFVNPENKSVLPPLFSKISEQRKNMACLEYLAALARRSNRLSKVFQWENLVLTLYDHAGVAPPSMNLIEDGGNSSMYDYERGTKCDYHDELECLFCSVLIAKKCCYWIGDAFSNIYGFDITENHLPVRTMPQYSIISAEDIIITKSSKKRFLGADSLPSYDPNLPASLQRESLRELLQSESSMDEDAGFVSRDIRYRRKHQRPKLCVGRGMAVAAWANAASRSHNDVVSVAETIDDVASAILEDDDSDSCVMADDEVSLDLASKTNARPPYAIGVLMQESVAGKPRDHIGCSEPHTLTQKVARMGIQDDNKTPSSKIQGFMSKLREIDCLSESSIGARGENNEGVVEEESICDDTVSAGDSTRLSVFNMVVNGKGKHFANSSVFAQAQRAELSRTPLGLGRGRIFPRSPVDSCATYQSDSD